MDKQVDIQGVADVLPLNLSGPLTLTHLLPPPLGESLWYQVSHILPDDS